LTLHTMVSIVLITIGTVVLLGGALAGLTYWIARLALRRLEATLGAPPQHTPWEWLFSLLSTEPREIALTAQRAARGTAAAHPMGSPKSRRWLDDLAFVTAAVAPQAATADRVDTTVTLGPCARHPVKLAMPVIVAPMAWGLSVTTDVKMALAAASAAAGVATASGEGPVLVEEAQLAHAWILQLNRGTWAHQRAAVPLADMVEIQLGQASEGNAAVVKHMRFIPPRVRRALHHHAPIVIHSGLPLALAQWVRRVRETHPGIPVGVKLPATSRVEADVLHVVRDGVDFITLEGSEAATASSPAVIHDHFGIPVSIAIRRADRALKAAGIRHRVSLLASGGLRGAADIAKVLALGADAAVIGTSLLFALAHNQVADQLPLRPPTALVFPLAGGYPPPLDADQALVHAAQWFHATRFELAMIAAALGITRLTLLGPDHLVSHAAETADTLAVDRLSTGPGATINRRLEELVDAYAFLNGLMRDLAPDALTTQSIPRPVAAPIGADD
jgi:glutamate synthase domain-containing protein 2